MRDHIFHKVFIPRNIYSEKYEGIKCFVLLKNCFSLKWIILLTKECIYHNKSLDDKEFYLKLDLLFIKTLKLNTVWTMRWFLKGIGVYNLPFFMMANQYLRKAFVLNTVSSKTYDLLFVSTFWFGEKLTF